MPLKFQTPEEFEQKINEYFNDTEFFMYTISGLCLHLGCNKDTFYEYCKREGYKEIGDHARLVIENSYEVDFRIKGRSSDIFAMKNFGWSDNNEQEHDNTKVDALIDAFNKIAEKKNE